MDASWVVLEPTWRRTKHHKNNMPKNINLQTPKRRIILRYGAPFGSQNQPKSTPKRVKIQDDFQERKKCSPRASWSRLGPILGHFGGHLGLQYRAPVHAGVCLVRNHVLDVDRLPRRVLDRSCPILAAKSAQNDPNLAPQNDPKSTKNRRQKMIKILIDFKTARMRFLDPTGGMRSPQGGTLGRSKNSAKEDLQ